MRQLTICAFLSLLAAAPALAQKPPPGLPAQMIYASLGKKGELVAEYNVMAPVIETRVRRVTGKDGVVREVPVTTTRYLRETRARTLLRFEVYSLGGMKIDREIFDKALGAKKTPILISGPDGIPKRQQPFYRADIFVVRELSDKEK